MNEFLHIALHWTIAASISVVISWTFLTSHVTDDNCQSGCTKRLEKEIIYLQAEIEELERKK